MGGPEIRGELFRLLEIILALCVIGVCSTLLSGRFIDMRNEALAQTCLAKRSELTRAFAHASEEARIDGARQSRTPAVMDALAERLVVQAGGSAATGGWIDMCDAGLWNVWTECVDEKELVYALRVRCSEHGGDSVGSDESQ